MNAVMNAVLPQRFERDWQIESFSKEGGEFNMILLHDLGCPSLVTCLDFTRDGKRLALGTYGAAQIFETMGMTRQEELRLANADTRAGFVRSLSFSPDGKSLLTGDENGKVCLWNLDSAGITFSWDMQHQVYAVAFSPNGRNIAAGSAHGSTEIYDADDHEYVDFVPAEHNVSSLVFSQDSSFLFVGSLDGRVARAEIKGEIIPEISSGQGHGDSVLAVAIAPDGKKVYTAGRDQLVKSWTLINDSEEKGNITQTLFGHKVSRCAGPCYFLAY